MSNPPSQPRPAFPAAYLGGPTVEQAGEQGVIEAIRHEAASSRNGDDAAVLGRPAPNSRTVVTTDMLVEGRHFTTEWSTPEEIGEKAVLQNFADIEAMGARPVAALLGVAAPPHTPVTYLADIAAGIHQRVAAYSAELVGGDITSSKQLMLSVTAIGQLGGSQPALTLDGARPGQKLVAAGRIGYSAAGLALLARYGRRGVPDRLFPLVEAHCAPYLQPGRGMIARATGATAMTDNSDGLVADLTTMARRSQVRINLFANTLGPDSLLLDAADLLGVDPWAWIECGGEDHTLIAATHHQVPSGFRVIGQVLKQRGEVPVSIDDQGPMYAEGWTSFQRDLGPGIDGQAANAAGEALSRPRTSSVDVWNVGG